MNISWETSSISKIQLIFDMYHKFMPERNQLQRMLFTEDLLIVTFQGNCKICLTFTISIRKAGANARIQKADSSYDSDHPQIKTLSHHLQLLLLAKPSQNGTLQARTSSEGLLVLSCTDDTSVVDSHALTAIQRRLVEANLKRRNRFLYAQRHAVKLSEKEVPSASIRAPRKAPLPPSLNALQRG